MRFSLALACLSLLALFGLLAADTAPAAEEGAGDGSLLVYIGTYTGRGSDGVYVSRLNLKTGQLTTPELAGEAVNPSFVAIHPSGRFLYAVGEIGKFEGRPTGGVTAFAIDRASGKLTRINAQSSEGAGPCHIVVDKEGKNALVANYGGGNVAVLPIAEDGSLKPASSTQQHEGSSVNKGRQNEPHAHSINLDPANRFAVAADLGIDKVMIYRFDPAAGKLAAADPAHVALKPGAGPRHFAFHPSGKLAFVINELHSSLTSMSYNAETGELKILDTQPTVPQPVSGNSTAEVVAHPNGRFVYGSNRGHDSVAGFSVDAESGKLTPIGHTKTGGSTPRNFNIDPTGAYLLAANQRGNNIVVFRINAETGELTETGHQVEVSQPVCIRFVK